jgi:peptidoglycan hydrolase-like protein with peptidoglycan-binding domain
VRRARKEPRDWGAEFRAFSERSRRGSVHAPTASFGTSDFGVNTNPKLSDVQARLNSMGASPPLKVDGLGGKLTTAAVVAFQRAHGLAPDGSLGPLTLNALGFHGATGLASGGTPPRGTFVPIKVSGPSSVIPGMRAVVVDNIPPLFSLWEGERLRYMYTDKYGLVTTGTGNLIDASRTPGANPVGPALALPWKHPDGTLASQQEISDAWHVVKNAFPAVQSVNSQSLTTLRLDKADVDKLVLKQVAANHGALQSIFPGYTSWPSDAQMAAHSLSWAWGPGFAHVWDTLGLGPLGTTFKSAVNKSPPDFVTAASAAKQAGDHEVQVKGNTGMAPRNAAQDTMFANAAGVVAKGGDPNSFFYPEGFTLVKAAVGGGALLILGGIGFGLWYLLSSSSPRQAARLPSSSPAASSPTPAAST